MRRRQPSAKKHYLANDYEDLNLWIDYWYQQTLIKKCKPKTVLEVGKGTGTLSAIMKHKDYKYATLDIDKNLKPDIVGNVINMPVKSNSFDLACAFQVLEHLPFSKFPKALSELRRVSKKYVVISLPYACFYFSFAFQFFYAKSLDKIFRFLKIIPFEPTYINLSIPFFFLKDKGMIKAHYWELGRMGYPMSKIKKIIQDQGFSIMNVSDRFFYPYHKFFVLKKK